MASIFNTTTGIMFVTGAQSLFFSGNLASTTSLPEFDIDALVSAQLASSWTPTLAQLSSKNAAIGGVNRITDVASANQFAVTGSVFEPATTTANTVKHFRAGLFSVEALGSGARTGQAQAVFGNVDVEGGSQSVAQGVHGEVYIQGPGTVGTAYGVEAKVYGSGVASTAYGVYSTVTTGLVGFNYYISNNTAGTPWGFYNSVTDLKSFSAGSWTASAFNTQLSNTGTTVIATSQSAVMAGPVKFTSTGRLTIQGTGRVRII